MFSDSKRAELAAEYNADLVLDKKYKQMENEADSLDIQKWLLLVKPASNDEWVSSVSSGSQLVASQYEQTLSWRITKPLRLLKKVQMSISHRGFGQTLKSIKNKLIK